MFIDMFGKPRLKLGSHTHTTLSDGQKEPEEVARIYAEAGYDAIAVTDHWKYNDECEINGLKILSGCEYDFGGSNAEHGVFHIVALCTTSDPEIPEDWKHLTRTSAQKAAEAVKMIKQRNGLAILAHPAWSLNTPEQIVRLGELDGLEIYNSVSDFGMSDRPYSGSVADMLATSGRPMMLLAADDAHYYTGDECRGYIMVEAVEFDSQSIVRAIRAGRFYATQGPEIHIKQCSPEKIKVYCSPASKIAFFSNVVWTPNRVFRGDGLVEAEYTIHPDDTFVRAEVTDADGRQAWSNIISLK